MTETQSAAQEAGKAQSVLIVTESDDYVETTKKKVKELSEQEMTGVYVTTNKPYKTITENLEDEGIETDKLFFIDTATESGDGTPDSVFVTSPKNLTDLSIAMSQAVKSIEQEEKYVLLDSISTLQVYNKEKALLKFAQFIVGKIREWEINGFMIAVKDDAEQDLINHLKSFNDQTIES